jgi:hypothetical protein
MNRTRQPGPVFCILHSSFFILHPFRMLTVITQAQQTPGTLTSGTVAVPQGGATINVGALMNAPDVSAPENQVTIAILWSFDGTTFPETPAAAVTWESGPSAVYLGTQTPSPPSFQCSVDSGVLAYQVQIGLPQALNIGAVMSINDINGNPLPISIVSQPVGGLA